MIKISCCPNFKLASFVSFKILIDLTLYVLMLISGGLNQEGSLLSPNQSALFYFGEKFPYYIKEHLEIYRLLTSLFLNVNIVQLIANIAGYMIFGSFVERFLGFFKTLIVFLIFGIGGCLFSCLFESQAQIDATSTTTGFIGFEAGVIIISWELWEYPGSGRYQMSMIILLGIVVNFTVGGSYNLIDNISMSAALVIGLLLSVVFMKSEKEKKKRRCVKWVLGIFIFFYFVIAICEFIFFINPSLI